MIVANTYQLKSIGIASKKTDKLDAAKLAEKLKAQVISDVQQIVPVTIPPKEIRDLRALFATYRALRKEIGQTKNRIHSLLKENLYPFTKEYIFGKKARKEIREYIRCLRNRNIIIFITLCYMGRKLRNIKSSWKRKVLFFHRILNLSLDFSHRRP